MDKLVLRSRDGATAELYRYGAHVTSWRPAGQGEEQLFLSTQSEFRAGAAIRGGVPVIFPQFAAEGPLPRHGFARTAVWMVSAMDEGADGDAMVTLQLASSAATHAIWPASFIAALTVQVGGDALRIALAVQNTGDEELSFTAALHSYLRVGDVQSTEVEGLEGVRYRESSSPGVLHVDGDASLWVHGEIDRVYVNAPSRLTVREPSREIVIETKGFFDAIVWNPGAERAAALSDMEPHGERHMLCVEAGAVQTPVRVQPGTTWSGSQTLVAVAELD